MGSEVESHIPNENHDPNGNNVNNDVTVTKTLTIVQPHSLLPRPAPPAKLNSNNRNDAVSRLAVGKFFRQRSNDLSSAISRGISSIKQSIANDESFNKNDKDSSSDVTEFNLPGVKVVVTAKKENDVSFSTKGRVISFFSRSNCRDCSAVRRLFRERGLRFVEINVDVYVEREKELVDRTGSKTVPKIFFDGELIGGLVELNVMMRNGDGELQRRLLREEGGKCSGADAPAAPAYGFDDDVAKDEEEEEGEMVRVVRVMRQRLPIQDRWIKMKLVRNCFSGTDLVDFLLHYLHSSRPKAVEIGKQLCQKHFIHHVLGENDFEEGNNNFYRFLEHEPFITKCFNFRGATNDSEPKAAAELCDRITKIMSAILESYASDDRKHVDYVAISKSEEFRRYVNMTQDLQRVDLLELSENEKLAFFLNLYNAMVIHAVIRVGVGQEGAINRRSFSDFLYLIGGHPYSPSTIKNGILRSNRRSPYSLVKPFSTGDPRLELALLKMNPLIHFGICNGTKSSPKVRFFSPHRVAEELRGAAREFFANDGIEVNLEKRIVYLSPIFKWYGMDFGQERNILNILNWMISYLDPNKAGLVTHLLSDAASVNISYKNYDWSINS